MKQSWDILSRMFAFSLFGIGYSKADLQNFDCNGAIQTYTENVQPIIAANCSISGCHNASSKAHGIDLSSFTKVVAESGRSWFLGAIEHVSGYDPMPEGRPQLNSEDVQTLSYWVENGNPE